MKISSALLIFGCQEKSKGSADVIGKFLSNKLQEKMVHTGLRYASDLIRSKEILISTINDFDSIILLCPEKIGGLPSDIIELMDILSVNKEQIHKDRPIMLLLESDFPEIEQNNLSVKIARNFSEKMKFKWQGVLCFSQSGMMRDKNLSDIKNKFKRIIKALEVLANNIEEGGKINTKAYELVNKKIMSVTSYNLSKKKQWKNEAKKYGTQKELDLKTLDI